MKPINFIRSASAQQHAACRKWFTTSVLFFSITILAMGILQVQQWYYACSLAHEKQFLAEQLKTFDTLLAQKQKQLGQKELLQNKLLKISRRTDCKDPAYLLKTIKTALKDQGTLESFSLSQKHLELKIGSNSTASLMKIADAVAGQSENGLSITALEHKEQNKIIAILKGNPADKKKVS